MATTTLDHTEAAPPEREIDVLRRGFTLLKEHLPAGWLAEAVEEVLVDGQAIDGLIVVTGPDGTRSTLVVEVKRLVAARDVPAVLDQLRSSIAQMGRQPAVPTVMARYL